MAISHSRLSSQGQVSVPAPIRRKLGADPGAILEWEDRPAGTVVVRRAGRFNSEDLHAVAFPDGPPATRTIAELKEGVAQAVRRRHARR